MKADSSNFKLFNEAELISLGIDWITLTQRRGDEITPLHRLAEPILAMERTDGNYIRPWASYGYEGFHCGQVDVGSRHDGEIARLSGGRAHESWTMLFPFSSSCSRIDLQMTIRYRDEVRKVLARAYRAAKRHRPDCGKPAIVTLLSSTDGSCTIYLGKRSSNQMGRIYDKGVQSRLEVFSGCVRFEVEYKGPLARSVARWLYHHPSRVDGILGQCSQFFSSRGVSSRITSIDRQVPLPSYVLDGCQAPADDAKSLRWLHASVSPTVARLVHDGKLDQVLDALGLSEHVTINTDDK